MKRGIIIVLILTMLLSLVGCTVRTDDSIEGSTKEPRIISTSAPLCTIMDELGLDLVGVPDTVFTIPERYKDATIVGAPMNPDFEIVKSLNPTDVLTPNSLQHDLQGHYQRIGVPATFVNLLSLDGMFKSIGGLGEKYNRVKEANAMISEYERFIDDYKKYTEKKESPTVLILFGLPGLYMVATEHSYVGSLVNLAGGINVFDETEALISVNTEALLMKNPDIILRTSHALPESVMAAFAQEFEENDIWKHFRAVKEGHVYDLTSNV